jgi:arylsulfatase A-like enzyme
MSGMKPIARAFVIAAAAALMALMAGCDREARRLNVVLIGVDTLRPDHLGCYGYDRETSPEIDKFAARGTLFENVVSQSPWTLPSFATIFTSLYPAQHGASALNTQLRTDQPTLAMMLLKRGYSTAGIINAPFLRPEFKLDRGFEYYDYKPPFAGRIADGTTDDALAWIDAHRDEPFFIFVHYFDPHLPYGPPPPYDTEFYPDYAGELPAPFDINLFPRARATNFETMRSVSAEDWDYIKALYDGEILFTDREVGRLISGLGDRGLEENTLIIVLSDHGEEFFEHGGFEHGHALYNEVIKVPLIVSLPGLVPENARLSEHVRLIDIAPTVLDFLGIEQRQHMEGVSLKPLITGNGEIRAAEAALLPPGIGYSESMLYGTERKAVTAYPWKYTYEMMSGQHTLMNLGADPGEMEDVSRDNPEALRPVEELLARTVFGISETWYIEISGGGEEHAFDIEVSSRAGRKTGSVYISRTFDAAGRMVDIGKVGSGGIGSGGITLRNLKLSSEATVAFKVEPENTLISVDARLDGEPAMEAVYLGTEMKRPDELPVSIHKRLGVNIASGVPAERPEGPYVLIWKSGKRIGGPAVFELGETIENELRSVGYLQ